MKFKDAGKPLPAAKPLPELPEPPSRVPRAAPDEESARQLRAAAANGVGAVCGALMRPPRNEREVVAYEAATLLGLALRGVFELMAANPPSERVSKEHALDLEQWTKRKTRGQ